MHRFNKIFFSSLAVYQQLGLLSTLPPVSYGLRFVQPKRPESVVDQDGVEHIDTWIAPVAGKMQMLTLAEG